MFVLDTNIVSSHRKQNPPLSLTEWLQQLDPDELSTTVATITELQRGIERARLNHPTVAQDIERWLEKMLAEGGMQILSMNVDAARILGRMYETPALRHFIVTDRQARRQATGADLAIAAIAIVNNGIVATTNIRHFLQVNEHFRLAGLFDPIAQAWHVRPT